MEENITSGEELRVHLVPMVIFLPAQDYIKYALDDFMRLVRPLFCVDPYPFGVGGFRYRLTEVNQSIFGRSENFPRIWLQNQLEKRGIFRNQKVAFCFINSSLEYYHKDFMEWLRKTWPNARLYGISFDTMTSAMSENVLPRLMACDTVYTFDLRDSETYGWRHFWGAMPSVDPSWYESGSESGDECIYDLCFIGDARGRYSELKKLYIRLEKSGIHCLFRILSQDKSLDEVDEKIMMRKKLPFKEVLHLENTSKILLDYGWLKHGQQGLSLRVMDAVGLGKSIITNSQYMDQCPIYNPETVGIVHSLDDIDPELIRTLADRVPVSYKNRDVLAGRNLVTGIIADFQ